ncbi:hypothetical protein IWX49DRAFT_69917 [Phyllosticta citricarpa]
MWPATTAFHPTLVLLVFLQLLRLAAPAQIGPLYFPIERQDPPQDPYVLPCCGDIQGGDVCAVVDIVEYGKVTYVSLFSCTTPLSVPVRSLWVVVGLLTQTRRDAGWLTDLVLVVNVQTSASSAPTGRGMATGARIRTAGRY